MHHIDDGSAEIKLLWDNPTQQPNPLLIKNPTLSEISNPEQIV
jgi:hypothetical protein